MLKKQFIPLFIFSLLTFGCGEKANEGTTEKDGVKVESANENATDEANDVTKILGSWRYEEDGGKSSETWTFSDDEKFLHEGSGAMTFKEMGIYSVEELKNGRASLVLTDIQGNMGSDDRTIIVNLGANNAEISVNNLTFKRAKSGN